ILITGFVEAEVIVFSSGELIREEKINANKSEVDSAEAHSEALTTSIVLEINSLEQEIINYNKLTYWSITNRYHAAGTDYNIDWSTYNQQEGTYGSQIQDRSAPPDGSGDLWDVMTSVVVNHTSIGKDAVRYNLYQTKTAHAF